MTCKECGEVEVIKVNKPEHVKFQCKNGHSWTEDYTDNGGPHSRPQSYEIKLDDVLFPSEKALYQKVLKEIEKDTDYYQHADPAEKTKVLMKKCKATEKEIYILMRKIMKYAK